MSIPVSTNKYASKSVLLLSHYATTAMQDFLKLYLNKHRVKRLTVMNFPLPEIPLLTHIDVYTYAQGKKVSQRKIRTVIRPGFLAYIFHFFQCFFLVCTLQKHDIVIAQNSMLALAALLGRGLGKVKHVVFYSHGISKKRFGFSLINTFYQLLDQFAYAHSDTNWALSGEILKSRNLLAHKPIHIVPASVPVHLFPIKKKLNKPTLIFIGTLNQMNGADLLPQILHELNTRGKRFYMDIIGVGPEMSAIKTMIDTYLLHKQIRLLGYQDVFQYAPSLSQYACGLAPYRNDETSLLSSTDPMKIQLYAAAGLPTIVTKGYGFSDRIQHLSMGFSTDADPHSFADAVIRLYANSKKYKHISGKSRRYAEQNDIYTIYEREFLSLL